MRLTDHEGLGVVDLPLSVSTPLESWARCTKELSASAKDVPICEGCHAQFVLIYHSLPLHTQNSTDRVGALNLSNSHAPPPLGLKYM